MPTIGEIAGLSHRSIFTICDFGNIPTVELESYARDYITNNFVPRGDKMEIMPFCETKDKIPVFFKSIYHKLACSRKDGVVAVDKTRIERLHWIVPVIEEKAAYLQIADDGYKRRYYINPLKYLVVLRREGKQFNLVTAYWVTEQWEKDRIREMMK